MDIDTSLQPDDVCGVCDLLVFRIRRPVVACQFIPCLPDRKHIAGKSKFEGKHTVERYTLSRGACTQMTLSKRTMDRTNGIQGAYTSKKAVVYRREKSYISDFDGTGTVIVAEMLFC